MVYLMARPRSANPKSIGVTVKMSEHDLALLDERRKSTSRSAYLRNLLVKNERPSMGSSVTEPRPIVDPVQPIPEPEPIGPPAPPDPPIETRHLHRFKKAGEPVSYDKGTPLYRQVCAGCGQTKVGA